MARTLYVFALLFLLGISEMLAQSGGGLTTHAAEQNYLPHKVIVKLKDSYRSHCKPHRIELPFFEEQLALGNIVSIHKYFPAVEPPILRQAPSPGLKFTDLSLIYEVRLSRDQVVTDWVRKLNRYPEIAYAEPEYIHRLFYQPNDPYADTTGGARVLWYLDPLQVREAWDMQRGDSSVVIGVVDSGTSFEHPDLKDNLAVNAADPIDGIDNDGDGYLDNYRGWDFGGDTLNTLGDNDPSYSYNYHGVAVEGIFAATPDNGIGIPGLGYHCKYLPIKATRDDPRFAGNIIGGYKGVVYAANQGAQLINCSWGGPTFSLLGADAVNYATINKGAGIIAASGNSGKDEAYYPASYDRVLSVTNISYQDTFATAFNPTYHYSVGVAAPGHNIYTTLGNDAYGPFSYTSSASPVAAGIVGIVKAHFPEYTGFQATQRVRVTTDDIYDRNPSYQDKLGSGRVNMLRALSDPLKPSVRLISREISPLSTSSAFAPGDTLLVQAGFINYLDPSINLAVSLEVPTLNESHVEIIRGNQDFGAVETNQFFALNQGFLLKISPNVPQNQTIALRFTYTDETIGYRDFEYVEFP